MTESNEKVKKVGVGSVATDAILAGKTNEEVLKLVQAQFPDKKTTPASINWYRNKLRADGHNVKTSRELRAAAKPKDPLA